MHLRAQSAAPALKSALQGSQSTAPATKSGHRGSPSAVPATKSALRGSRKCCACHEICTSRFTKRCACHEICTSRFTKRCAPHEICTSRFTKRCACHEICTSRCTKCFACHEICASRFTKSKVLCLPRNRHFKVHKVLPRNLQMSLQKSQFTAPVTKSELVQDHHHVQSTVLATKTAFRSKTAPIPCTCHTVDHKNTRFPSHLPRKVTIMCGNARDATTSPQSLEAPARGTQTL